MHRKLSFFVLILLLLAACTACPEVTGTPAAANATVTPRPSVTTKAIMTPMALIEIEYVEVTRIVTMAPSPTRFLTPTRTPTATPMPNAVQACFNQATTQGALNGCAALARDEAEKELAATLARITWPDLDQEALRQMVTGWENQAWEDCEFLYGGMTTMESGTSYYTRGSSAPMHLSLCVANRLQQHIDELTYAYLTE